MLHAAALAAPRPTAPTLHAVPLVGRVDSNVDVSLGSLVAEDWSHAVVPTDGGRGFALTGSSRAFLASDAEGFMPATLHSWRDISFRKLRLADQQLGFTVDLSSVGCGCNAAVYLVQMAETPATHMASGYCDIQAEKNACVELDLLEGNRKAVQATLHAQRGTGADGRCNQDGCRGNLGKDGGKDGSEAYYGAGAGARVQSSRPFRVTASFPRTGRWRVAQRRSRAGRRQLRGLRRARSEPERGSARRRVGDERAPRPRAARHLR